MIKRIQNPVKAELIFKVTSDLNQYASEVVGRLGYLYPEAEFSLVEGNITVSGLAADRKVELTRAVRYGLYRAKINNESKPLRDILFREMFKR